MVKTLLPWGKFAASFLAVKNYLARTLASFKPKENLTQEDLERSFKYIIKDGIASQAMATLTGGIFLTAFALRFGANNTFIGILAALPALANLIQIPSIYLVEWLRNRRLICVVFSLLSRSMLLFIVFSPFLEQNVLSVIMFAFALHNLLAGVSACSWNSWMRDLIPQKVMGTFFGRRLKLTFTVGIVLSFLASWYIDFWGKRFSALTSPLLTFAGYPLLFLTGTIAGLWGAVFLTRTSEPLLKSARTTLSFIDSLRQPFKDDNFRILLFFTGLWNFSINLAAPFFTVYLLRRLGMGLTMVMVLSIVNQTASMLFFELWGRIADRWNNKSVLKVCGFLFLFCILGWTFTTLPQKHLLTLPILFIVHCLSGVASSGITLAQNNIGMKLAPQERGTSYLAMMSLLSSFTAGVAPVIGGSFADFFTSYELSIRVTFKTPFKSFGVQPFSIEGWDFFFLFAFILGFFAIRKILPKVKEEGEVSSRILLQELFGEVGRGLGSFSTLSGLRFIWQWSTSIWKR
ncbi:MFS transporter [Atrimonas thermophila]|uniref:MFS transporter n=1 Tax=Atrimonas thermophila TaxID=3064161 RepID=UPI00399D1B69